MMQVFPSRPLLVLVRIPLRFHQLIACCFIVSLSQAFLIPFDLNNNKCLCLFQYIHYCSLCGQSSHTAAQGCYRMKDEKGRAVMITPGQIPCNICEKKINKKLYHPLRYCFNKERSNMARTNNQNGKRF